MRDRDMPYIPAAWGPDADAELDALITDYQRRHEINLEPLWIEVNIPAPSRIEIVTIRGLVMTAAVLGAALAVRLIVQALGSIA